MFAARNMTFARPVAGGGGGFDPLSLSPALWLDASDSSTLYDATTGGSLVAADGLVARWEDKSGNARHATQATSGLSPIRKTSIKNSKDVLRYGGAQRLDGALVNLSAMTVFAVFASSAANDVARIYSQRGSANNQDFSQTGHYIPIIRDGTSANLGSYASTGFRSVYSTTLNQFYIIASKHTGSQITNYKDGSSLTPYTHTLGDNGAGYTIGDETPTGGSTGDFSGDICEIIVYPSALSDTDRGNVESYLNAKWAIY